MKRICTSMKLSNMKLQETTHITAQSSQNQKQFDQSGASYLYNSDSFNYTWESQR